MIRRTIVVFDIDGTLLQSAGEHHLIIAEALGRHGLDVLAKPWAEYRHYTDSGVIDEVMIDTNARPVTAEELLAFDREYHEGLLRFVANTPFREVPGATRLLAELAAMPGVTIVFATGSLRSMAGEKLRMLGLDPDAVVLETGSEHLTRERIVCAAVAGAGADLSDDVDVVSLGDGRWDELAAANLGIPFIALETGQHRFGPGPVRVLTDFSRFDGAALVSYAGPFAGCSGELVESRYSLGERVVR